jgi:hypothetical protein
MSVSSAALRVDKLDGFRVNVKGESDPLPPNDEPQEELGIQLDDDDVKSREPNNFGAESECVSNGWALPRGSSAA